MAKFIDSGEENLKKKKVFYENRIVELRKQMKDKIDEALVDKELMISFSDKHGAEAEKKLQERINKYKDEESKIKKEEQKLNEEIAELETKIKIAED